VDITHQLGLALRRLLRIVEGHAVDAHVDHHSARLDPVAADHPRAADGGDQDVGLAAYRREVVRARVGDGHGAVRL